MLATILGFAMVAGVMLYVAARSRETVSAQRLDTAMRAGGLILSGTGLDESLSQSWYRRLAAPAFSRAMAALVTVASPRVVAVTQERMERAGKTSGGATTGFLLTKGALALVGVGGVGGVVFYYEGPWTYAAVIGIAILAATTLVPEAIVNVIITQRQAQVRKSLPDVIDLLAVSAEAGTGLDGALSAVLRRKPGPLADEFGRLLFEMRLGKSRHEAWADMAKRVGLPELQSFVATLEQADQMGVSIANTLRAQSDAMRLKQSLMIRQQAATLALKMVFPLVFCILPALFVVVLGPGLMAIRSALGVMK